MSIEDALSELSSRLISQPTLEEALKVLKDAEPVRRFASEEAASYEAICTLSAPHQCVVFKVIAAGQINALQEIGFFENPGANEKLLEYLAGVDAFYISTGGLIGYQALALKLLRMRANPNEEQRDFDELLQPQGYDLRDDAWALKWALQGLSKIETLAMLCPIGGAGDRFGLVHPKTKKPLPLAKLLLLGKTLLEHIALDLVGLEYLYYKCYRKQALIPMGLMTSDEKDNHSHIEEILSENNYFLRGKEAFTLFKQPCVPAFDSEGNWLYEGNELLLKPGGHGMIWTLAKNSGFLDALMQKQKTHLLVRQINNPLCSLDTGLLAFLGVGLDQKKSFGFASCPRSIGSKEGMDVVKEKKEASGNRYTLTNVEYTEFKRFNLEDVENAPGSGVSAFPSNTNILFASIEALLPLLQEAKYPGPILNFKEGKSARIELMMQNIADFLGEEFKEALSPNTLNQLKAYLTYNDRKKTISTTKNKWEKGKPLAETNAGALFDLLSRTKLLLEGCGIEMPAFDQKEYEDKGAPFALYIHPALGPFFSIIRQKIRGGKLHEGSQLILDIAELDVENLNLKGKMHIHALCPCGFVNGAYSEQSGKCTLKNVTVQTQSAAQSISIDTLGKLSDPDIKITIEGSGEFIAEDVTFEKPMDIVVPSGMRMRAYQGSGQVEFENTSIDQPSWSWEYVAYEDRIDLLKKTYEAT